MREEIEKQVLDSNSNNILLELATGVGKTKIALAKVHQWFTNNKNILIVIPRVVLKQNWKDEIIKWGYQDLLSKINFVTYTSFIKGKSDADIVIYDEAHHLSDRCLEIVDSLKSKHSILLSASLTKEKKREILYYFSPEVFKVATRKAIDNNILPDPTVYLIPLELNKTEKSEIIVKNKNKKYTVRLQFSERFNTKKYANNRIEIVCTQYEYYSYLESLTSYYERQKFTQFGLTKYLRTAGERAKYLSSIKVPIVLKILKKLEDKRTLTFCKDIEQTELLGKNPINSKNKQSIINLKEFNEGKINHITSCNMIDEGINLTDCKYAIFAFLNSSDKMIIQKTGRALRHPSPVIIIPYFVNTREEDLVTKMCENFNKNKITKLNYKNL